jgi:large subunit ribosomal protein L25
VYEHVDLIAVRKGEKITIDVPLRLIGEIAPGGLLAQEYNSVSVEAEATHLPTEIEISVEGLEVGAHFIAGDLVLPAGAILVTDHETLLVHISEAPSEADMAAQGEGGAAELTVTDEAAASESPAA